MTYLPGGSQVSGASRLQTATNDFYTQIFSVNLCASVPSWLCCSDSRLAARQVCHALKSLNRFSFKQIIHGQALVYRPFCPFIIHQSKGGDEGRKKVFFRF